MQSEKEIKNIQVKFNLSLLFEISLIDAYDQAKK